MFILTDSDGVVVAIGNEVVESNEEQGVICINGACYGLVGQKVWELEDIPEHIVPYKYKYVDGEFTINENYKPDVDVETLIEQQEQIDTLTVQVENLQRENELLKMENKELKERAKELENALLEMTTISAMQEQKLQENEQAILELSMLLGGGN